MVQHDFDVTAFGNPKGYIDNGFEPNKPTYFYSDKTLVDNFKKEANEYKDTSVVVGIIATGDVLINQEKRKDELRKAFNASAIDMECAAIAQTAKRNNIPLIVIKTISDSENNSILEYKLNKNLSAVKSSIIIKSIFNKKKKLF